MGVLSHLVVAVIFIELASGFLPHTLPRHTPSPPANSLLSSSSSSSSSLLQSSSRHHQAPIALGASPALAEEEGVDVVTSETLFDAMDSDESGTIDLDELRKLLESLDIQFSDDEVCALFSKLDEDGSGSIDREEFSVWFEGAFGSALEDSSRVFSTIVERRTVHTFEEGSVVPDAILRKAVTAATAAPNHRMTEPWRFTSLGPNAVAQVAALNAKDVEKEDARVAKEARWKAVPGWVVVTCGKEAEGVVVGEGAKRRFLEDYAATCCAIQNFQLVMWAEGVGVKWTTGDVTRSPEFLEICGIDGDMEEVVGCLWYGYAKGGLEAMSDVPRKKALRDVLRYVE